MKKSLRFYLMGLSLVALGPVASKSKANANASASDVGNLLEDKLKQSKIDEEIKKIDKAVEEAERKAKQEKETQTISLEDKPVQAGEEKPVEEEKASKVSIGTSTDTETSTKGVSNSEEDTFEAWKKAQEDDIPFGKSQEEAIDYFRSVFNFSNLSAGDMKAVQEAIKGGKPPSKWAIAARKAGKQAREARGKTDFTWKIKSLYGIFDELKEAVEDSSNFAWTTGSEIANLFGAENPDGSIDIRQLWHDKRPEGNKTGRLIEVIANISPGESRSNFVKSTFRLHEIEEFNQRLTRVVNKYDTQALEKAGDKSTLETVGALNRFFGENSLGAATLTEDQMPVYQSAKTDYEKFVPIVRGLVDLKKEVSGLLTRIGSLADSTASTFSEVESDVLGLFMAFSKVFESADSLGFIVQRDGGLEARAFLGGEGSGSARQLKLEKSRNALENHFEDWMKEGEEKLTSGQRKLLESPGFILNNMHRLERAYEADKRLDDLKNAVMADGQDNNEKIKELLKLSEKYGEEMREAAFSRDGQRFSRNMNELGELESRVRNILDELKNKQEEMSHIKEETNSEGVVKQEQEEASSKIKENFQKDMQSGNDLKDQEFQIDEKMLEQITEENGGDSRIAQTIEDSTQNNENSSAALEMNQNDENNNSE